METPQAPLKLDDLYTLEQFAERHPNVVSMATLRWQLRDRNINGLAPAVVRIGKNLFISESRYAQWLDTRTGIVSRGES